MQAYAATPAYQKALRKRQVWVEPLFGEAKEWHGLGRCRLRGLERINSAVLLIAGGQNLKRLLATRGWPPRRMTTGRTAHAVPACGGGPTRIVAPFRTA